MNLESIHLWLQQNPLMNQIITLLGMLLFFFLVYLLTHKIILRVIAKLVQRTPTRFDDLLLQTRFFKYLAFLVAFIVLHNFAYLLPAARENIERFARAGILLFILLMISSILNLIHLIYDRMQTSRRKSIKGYLEIIKIIIFVMGGIFIIGILTGQSPWVLMSGIGALTAIIILIFRDTILSFVASLQINSYDLIRIGDWIEAPKFGADGEVTDIALHTIKIQNWDKTISIIPTHKLLQETFKNWRGMQQTGGRRIKRSIYIDINSIRFCNEEMLNKYKNITLLKNYIEKKQAEIEAYNRERQVDPRHPVNARRMTNIGTFRAYLEAYLQNHPRVHPGLISMVRQLPSGPQGLPIEIYLFTNETAWKTYEAIQADIFDHIFAVLPEFDLRIFQYPSGKDLQPSLNSPLLHGDDIAS
ncbi:MAG: mechanosensitive ion channel [Calditrichia bacterium]